MRQATSFYAQNYSFLCVLRIGKSPEKSKEFFKRFWAKTLRLFLKIDTGPFLRYLSLYSFWTKWFTFRDGEVVNMRWKMR